MSSDRKDLSPGGAKQAAVLPFVIHTFLVYFSIALPLAVLPIFVKTQLGLSAVMAGLAISIQYISTVVSRAQVGRMTDVLGPKRTSFLGFLFMLLAAAFTLGTAFLTKWPWTAYGVLAISRLALGIAESMVATTAITWVIARAGPNQSVKAMSWNGIATYGALALGAPVGVALTSLWGLPAIAAVTGAIGLLGLYLTWIKQDARLPKAPAHARTGFWQVLKAVTPYGLALGLAATGFGVLTAFITLLYADRHWPGAAFAVSAFGLSFVGVRLGLTRAIRRFGGLPIALAAMVIEFIGLVAIWMAGAPQFALVGAALTGFGFGPLFPSLGRDVMAQAPPDAQGAALGLYCVFPDAALGAAGPMAGFLIGRFGYSAPFALGAGAVAGAFAITAWIMKEQRSASAATR